MYSSTVLEYSNTNTLVPSQHWCQETDEVKIAALVGLSLLSGVYKTHGEAVIDL